MPSKRCDVQIPLEMASAGADVGDELGDATHPTTIGSHRGEVPLEVRGRVSCPCVRGATLVSMRSAQALCSREARDQPAAMNAATPTELVLA